jgi:hypothetical protein
VFISVAILTLTWPSILDCHFNGQLRADYIRGQVCQEAEVSPIREQILMSQFSRERRLTVSLGTLDIIESYIVFA